MVKPILVNPVLRSLGSIERAAAKQIIFELALEPRMHELKSMNHGQITRAIFLACAFASLDCGLKGEESRISFRNDVMAVLSKAGCNAGACHGNANGKASFKLSLRGESPDLDYLALTHDQFARRVDPLAPEQSLILQKPATVLAHEGGQRFKKDSREYDLLRRWIAAGAKDDAATAARLERIEVTPVSAVLLEPTNTVQIHSRAFFSDSEQRDLTSIATY